MLILRDWNSLCGPENGLGRRNGPRRDSATRCVH